MGFALFTRWWVAWGRFLDLVDVGVLGSLCFGGLKGLGTGDFWVSLAVGFVVFEVS